MVVLKSVKVESSKKSSELLVLGRFKNVDIKKTISFLSLEDQNIILNAISVDLSDGDSGDYIMIPGSSSSPSSSFSSSPKPKSGRLKSKSGI